MIDFLVLIKAAMIIQAICAWRPGSRGSVKITFFPRLVVTAGRLEHSKHIMPPAAFRVNTFICKDSSKPFSIIHDWKVLLSNAADWLLAETDDAFITESKEPLQSLLLAFAHSGCWITVRNLCLDLYTTKTLLYAWMASFMFLLWHYLMKIPTQERRFTKCGKGLACWKHLTPWKRLGLQKTPDQVAFKALIVT